MTEGTEDLVQLIKMKTNLKNNKMTLDLEKLAKLERKYRDDSITLDALHNMVLIVTSSQESAVELVSTVQFLTLLDLGVIKGVTTTSQQLNS
jgi:hypothetical protein